MRSQAFACLMPIDRLARLPRGLSPVGGQVARADQEEDEAEARTGTTESMATVRLVTPSGRLGRVPARADRGEEPADRRVDHGRLAEKVEIQPRRIGELMSPNKWIRKMNTRRPSRGGWRARRWPSPCCTARAPSTAGPTPRTGSPSDDS